MARRVLASAFIATGNYFEVLGVAARVGRTFTPADDAPGATAAAP